MLFSDIIIGPIHSRRLGVSLGVNLLPTSSKICNFDCIYCECGWNRDARSGDDKRGFASKDVVLSQLEEKLSQMNTPPDVITFAGNGEPTLHPNFETIIEGTISLRDRYAPSAKVAVLSNATRLSIPSVYRALQLVDQNILKLDAARPSLISLINKPQGGYNVAHVIEQLASFKGEVIVQTMFLRGKCDGVDVDNTHEDELELWIDAIKKIAPKEVMLYSLDRTPPCSTLEAVSYEEMEEVAKRLRTLSIPCTTAK